MSTNGNAPGAQGGERGLLRDAAIAVVASRGYRAASVAAICNEAGLSRAAFERHFEDLEDCFCQFLEEIRNDLFERVGQAFIAETGWRDQIRATAYAMVDFMLEDMERARYLAVEVLFGGERAQLIRDQGMQLLFDLIDLGREEAEDPAKVSRATAEAIGGSVYNQLQVAIEQRQLSRDLVPRLLYNVVLPYLGSEAALEELHMSPAHPAAAASRTGGGEGRDNGAGAPAQSASPSSERARIAQAMVELTAEHGYERLTERLLLEQAGVDRETFERHFSDLEDCYCQLFVEFTNELRLEIERTWAKHDSWRDRIRGIAYTMLAYLEEDERRMRFLAVEVPVAGDRVQALRARALEELFELIDLGRRERPPHGHRTRATAEAVGGAVLTQGYLTLRKDSLAAVRERIPELMYSVMLPYL